MKRANADDPAPETVSASRRQPIKRRHAASSRLTRFVDAYGWRSYALPILVVATVIALIVVVRNPVSQAGGPEPARESSTTSAAPTSTTPAAPSTTTPAPPPPPPSAAPTSDYAQVGDASYNVVPGASAVLGVGPQLITFDVAVEGGITIDTAAFALEVERILGDPRSWIASGEFSLQRVDNGQAAMHILLVTPDHVESLCPGYNTNGYTSCRNGDNVVINLARWSTGVEDYAGFLYEYREYVINHETGHFFGHEHVPCPGPGRKAPVMMQQTLGLDGCAINAWPYPNGPADDLNAPA